jgi:glycosyltransferase involved in cell wall biosynthesis
MNIAMIGSRGIPNTYGGFEQFAERLSIGLVKRGHNVTVYSPHHHIYKDNSFNGVSIIHIFDPASLIGSASQFIYDYLCLRDALGRDFDIIYELGYHSNAPAHYLCDLSKGKIVTNMDGLEWQREKWGNLTRRLIKKMEALAVRTSHHLVADSPGIQTYLRATYGVDSTYISYGADIPPKPDNAVLDQYGLSKGTYYLLIARIEPENNIETVIQGYMASSNAHEPLFIVGGHDTKYASRLIDKYSGINGIIFPGGIFNTSHLDALRSFSKLYFHGHSVGGTNPSLLEAMAAGTFIAAHDNAFNKAILGDETIYFKTADDVKNILSSMNHHETNRDAFIRAQAQKIHDHFSWEQITDQYEKYFSEL